MQFNNNQKDYFPDHLRPLEDFVKEGEWYVLKTSMHQTDPTVPVQKTVMTLNCTPEHQNPAANQEDPERRQLISAVKLKAERLVSDQQTEALLIILISAQLR